LSSSSLSSSLGGVLFLTGLNSMSSGVVVNGIYFLTKHGYGFSELENYSLATAQGVGYAVGALRSSHMTARWQQRPALAALLVMLGALCALPAIFPGSAVAITAMALVYSPLCGAMWPIVQSFVSAGRAGEELQRALGRFSLTWSGTLVLAYWGVAPLCKDGPQTAILLLGCLHWLSLLGLPRTVVGEAGPQPASEAACPPQYVALLAAFRWLLPLSTLLMTTLHPFLPATFTRLLVPAEWHTVLVTGWLLPRAVGFFWLERSQRWRGRPSLARQCAALLLCGFALSILAPNLWLEALGLLLYGAGMAQVYTGAIYYAQSVGRAAVSAGGRNEALIGAGFALGPVIGLVATGSAQAGLVAAEKTQWAVVLPAVGIGLCLCAAAFRALRR
jgi:MFS family permease